MAAELQLEMVPTSQPDIRITMSWEMAQALRFALGNTNGGVLWDDNPESREHLGKHISRVEVDDAVYRLYCILNKNLE